MPEQFVDSALNEPGLTVLRPCCAGDFTLSGGCCCAREHQMCIAGVIPGADGAVRAAEGSSRAEL
jgi:hypothetical protein